MKKEYIAPDVEIINFDICDIITSSTLEDKEDPYETDIF